MDRVIEDIKELIDNHEESLVMMPFFEYVWTPPMEDYFKKKHAKTHRGEPPDETYCLRVRQDYYRENIHHWQQYYEYWYDPPALDDPYIHAIWKEEHNPVVGN
jgi:hypothetical protein